MTRALQKTFSTILSILLFLTPVASYGEIYKYKDKHGRWQFSDTPPDGIKSTKKHTYQNTPSKIETLNLLQSLTTKYTPKTPIEKATLAVFTIQSRLGSGSGFFVSDECHLITNKHVVRPTETNSWQKNEETLKAKETNLAKIKQTLKDEEERLKRYKRELSLRLEYISSLRPSGFRNAEEEEYNQHKALYKRDLKTHEKNSIDYKKKEEAYRKEWSEFSLDSSIANVAKTFKVVLKDGAEVQAQLLKLSDKKDLALLHIRNCISPFLVLDSTSDLHQGMQIYSIGSPLGQSDHVTSGIITHLSDDKIVIDAQILPGNSGGPLITSEGKAIGVNTLKLSQESPNAEGFGISIPANEIKKDFNHLLE